MEIKQLTEFEQIENIYKTRMKNDFPYNELHPLFVMRKIWDAGDYHCFGWFDDEELLGYAFFIKLQDGSKLYYLFDYLAISDGRRNEGLGSRFLKELPAHIKDPDCILVEVAYPSNAPVPFVKELRTRRLGFYKRSGCHVTDVTARVYGADYRIIEFPVGTLHSPEEICSIYTALYEHISPKWFLKKFFEVGIEGD